MLFTGAIANEGQARKERMHPSRLRFMHTHTHTHTYAHTHTHTHAHAHANTHTHTHAPARHCVREVAALSFARNG